MGILIAQTVVIRSEKRSKSTDYHRTSFPPNYYKNISALDSLSLQEIERMSSKEMRAFLKNRCKMPTRDKHGLPYAYRVLFAGGKNSIRTLFPATKRGEKIPVHGRLDYDIIMAQQATRATQQ